jgi:MOSC domain-containing protein YiiM
VTEPTDPLLLSYEGIPGDRHFGWTRRSGGREPWYPRGTEMRNERQLSLLAPDELLTIAERLGVPEVRAEWIGGNLVIDGVPHFSMLPAGTRLTFEGGAVIAIEAQNHPCRFAGRSIASHYPDQPHIELAFAKVAKRLRGLIGWVEMPGEIRPGASVSARLPEQWIYPPAS